MNTGSSQQTGQTVKTYSPGQQKEMTAAQLSQDLQQLGGQNIHFQIQPGVSVNAGQQLYISSITQESGNSTCWLSNQQNS